jgi:uncharacterized protein YbjT (DUF2867 family)
MHIAVVGATGATGQQFVLQALARGHHVRALVRTPQKFPLQHPHLDVIQGDAFSLGDVSRTLQGQDAVFCALGSGENLKPTTIRSEGTRQIIQASGLLGITPHVVILSSLGAGDSKNQLALSNRLIVRQILRHVLADHEMQEGFIRQSPLPWTILRPAGLNDEAGKGSLRATTPPQSIDGRTSISRADVAAFALSTLENHQHVGQMVTLSAK